MTYLEMIRFFWWCVLMVAAQWLRNINTCRSGFFDTPFSSDIFNRFVVSTVQVFSAAECVRLTQPDVAIGQNGFTSSRLGPNGASEPASDRQQLGPPN